LRHEVHQNYVNFGKYTHFHFNDQSDNGVQGSVSKPVFSEKSWKKKKMRKGYEIPRKIPAVPRSILNFFLSGSWQYWSNPRALQIDPV
jgi:hypothetical protein